MILKDEIIREIIIAMRGTDSYNVALGIKCIDIVKNNAKDKMTDFVNLMLKKKMIKKCEKDTKRIDFEFDNVNYYFDTNNWGWEYKGNRGKCYKIIEYTLSQLNMKNDVEYVFNKIHEYEQTRTKNRQNDNREADNELQTYPDNIDDVQQYSDILKRSKNIIFRGAPGTGKTYLAKKVATNIVSDGEKNCYEYLDDNQKKQIGFVQFHPSYDYSDFVEGLRPEFRKNKDDNDKDADTHDIGFSLQPGIFKKFIYEAKKLENKNKKYVFIIDEINRGEISKIFGELLFSIDPDYRGRAGEVYTQYANMHEIGEGKFYIPDNVFIIGTMNDIDRSVDSFDFAMRRRFRFIEISAEDSQEMLDNLGEKKNEAIKRMNNLNKEIIAINELNENYQIGAAYFRRLKDMSLDELWNDSLRPLLQDYIRGMHNEKDIMRKFENAYKGKDGDSN